MRDSSSPDDEPGQELVPAPPPPAPDRNGSAGSAEPIPAPDPGAEPPDTAPARDAHGFDPADYRWVPVLRRPRRDGWTPQRQLDFIRTLADIGIVEEAARAAGMSVTSCYRLRNSPEGAAFAAAWEAALAYAARKLVDIAFERAIHGTEEPVFDREGRRVGRRLRQNDRLLMFLLRGFMPERFRYAHRDLRTADEPSPPPEVPLDEAMARLLPVAPPDPHQLIPPDALAEAFEVTDIVAGELPSRHGARGDAGPAGTPAAGAPPVDPAERMLENAKHASANLPPRGEGEEEGGEGGFLA